ncbi:MAG: glycosyltransferase [Anaerolineae bacterium]
MKILQVIATAGRTGAESVVLSLSAGLREQGVDCSVLCFGTGVFIDDLRNAGVPCTVMPVRSKFDVGSIMRLRAYLQAEQIDVVHTHGPRAMFLANPAARLAGVPVVTTFHEFSNTKAYETRLYRLYEFIERLLSRYATDHLIAISEAIRDDALRVRHIPAAKLTRIYNPVSTQQFGRIDDQAAVAAFRRQMGIPPATLLIGAVGRLTPMKGHRVLIDAFPSIQQAFPQARLLIVGAGPLESELRAQAQALGIDVLFPGVVTEMKLLYNALDVLVHPSLDEPFGLVVLEAIACGVPVVATAVGGLTEIANLSLYHRIVAPENVQALAEAVRSLLHENPPRAPASNLEALFSAEAVAQQHLAIYRSVQR